MPLALRLSAELGVFGCWGDMKTRFSWDCQVATFWVGCFVMLVNLLTAAVNWQKFEKQRAIQERLAALEQRAANFADTQGSHTRLPPSPKGPQ
jgi:hypothetical protein